MSLRELEDECSRLAIRDIVDGLIPESSVNIVCGDSGLGKSPFAYQLCMCVAMGVPFLGHSVQQGDVLYVDLENGRLEILALGQQLCRFLGGGALPDCFHVVDSIKTPKEIETLIQECHPILVVIDSLRAFCPEAEDKNKNGAALLTLLKQIARKYHVAFLLIHHIRKPGENGAPVLEDCRAGEWLLQASGARSLINQTDVRIALAAPLQRSITTLAGSQAGGTAEPALVVKGFARLRGEFGPLFLAREFDDEGEAIGYRQLRGIELVFNHDQQTAFERLPVEFAFKQAKQIYGRGDQATKDWLQKLLRAGVVKQPAKRGAYFKSVE